MKDPIKNMVWHDYPHGSITQWFGENPTLYARWGLKAHNGIDIVAPHGTPMYAVEDGFVVDIKSDPNGFGMHIRLRAEKPDANGHYRCWVYGHCSKIISELGDKVNAGDHIANMGNTGFVVSGSNPFWDHNPYAGTHLHLGLRLLEPDNNGWRYKGDFISYNVVDYDNGYKGAVDPSIWFSDSSPATQKQYLTLLSLANKARDLLIALKLKRYG